MKTMIKYRGGKTKEIPQIMWHVPFFEGKYVEPFFGGGALYFHLEPHRAIINDINSKLMGFYKGVRDDFPTLRRELDEIESIYSSNRDTFDKLKAEYPNKRVEDKNEDLYYQMRLMFNDLAPKLYSDALLYYYINKTAYSGMIRYNAQGEFNVPFGRYGHLNTQGVTKAHSDLLKNAEIYNGDYSLIFDMCKVDDFVFLDPPYDCVFSDYGNEEYKDGFNEDNHRRLASDFFNLPCKALLVIGKTTLTSELYRGNIVEEYAKNYAVNIRNRFKSSASHVIVTNYRKSWSISQPISYERIPIAENSSFLLFERSEPYGKKDK